MPTLFDPVRLGALELRNRIVMAPLTRARATADRVPTDVMREHYEQRASARQSKFLRSWQAVQHDPGWRTGSYPAPSCSSFRKSTGWSVHQESCSHWHHHQPTDPTSAGASFAAR